VVRAGSERGGEGAAVPNPKSTKPSVLNPSSKNITPDKIPQTLDPQPLTLNPKAYTLHPKS
jgi:hypothetical protein